MNRLSAEVKELKNRGKGHPRFGPVPPALDFRFRAALKMEENAKAEGDIYGNVAKYDVGGLKLEHELSFISKRFVKKDLYYGDANLFDWTFSADQKRVIFYLLSLMSREYLCRRRKWLTADLV